MTRKKPITIAGAGLSGLTAAVNLAREGYEVKVYERKEFVGQSREQNPQLLPNWFRKKDVIEEMEECGIKVNWVNRMRRVKIHLPKGRVVFYSKKTPIGYTVLRGGEGSFEQDLARQAEEQGAEIVLGRRKEKADILATGKSEPITVGFGQVFQGRFDPQSCSVFFDPAFTPSVGYGYLFPHSEERATVKMSKRVGEEVDVKSSLERLKKDYLEEEIGDGRPLYTFPTVRSFKRVESAKKQGSILVGEAAGFQDELFRFGMRYAVISGFLAARSIIENEDYDRLWKRRFEREFDKTARIRRMFCLVKKRGLGLFPSVNVRIPFRIFKVLWTCPVVNTVV